MDASSYFRGKKITVMGLGLLGRGVGDARYLAECGADVIVTDLKTAQELAPSVAKLSGFKNIRFSLGGHTLSDFQNRDLIIKGSAIPRHSPYLKEAQKYNTPVRMSIDLFAELTKTRIIGITGTRGKTSTAYLIKAILDEAKLSSVLGGNIVGTSNLELIKKVHPGMLAVLELDAWQLNGFGAERISPSIAVFTTFFPDHLYSYNNSLDLYLEEKAQIFLHQKSRDTLIIGAQAKTILSKKYAKNIAQALIANSSQLSEWEMSIPGIHNRDNAACALLVARTLGIKESTIRDAIKKFKGVPGRLELIRTINGIRYYNDGAAIIQEATIAALEALKDSPIILIIGGRDKKLPIEKIAEIVPKCSKKVILFEGTGTDTIKDAFPSAYIHKTLSSALQEATSEAEHGDVVLFSPAFSSMGSFSSVYDRIDQFTELVKKL